MDGFRSLRCLYDRILVQYLLLIHEIKLQLSHLIYVQIYLYDINNITSNLIKSLPIDGLWV